MVRLAAVNDQLRIFVRHVAARPDFRHAHHFKFMR